MALQKSKTLSNGASGNYWKITHIVLERMTSTVNFVISLFSDQAHGQANSPTLGISKNYSFSVTKEQADGNLISFGYNSIKIKAASMIPPINGGEDVVFDPDLSGATDV